MKKYNLRFAQVNRDFFDAICDGRKTIETRAATTKYQPIQPGDILVLSCGKHKFEKTVQRVESFPSITALFQAVPLKNVNPFAATVEQAEAAYYTFPGYKQKIADYGLVAFFLD